MSILEIIGKKLEGDLAVSYLQGHQKNQEESSVIQVFKAMKDFHYACKNTAKEMRVEDQNALLVKVKDT